MKYTVESKDAMLQEIYDHNWDIYLVEDAIAGEDLSKYKPIFRKYYLKELKLNKNYTWKDLYGLFLEEGDNLDALIRNINPNTNMSEVEKTIEDFCKEVVCSVPDDK